MSNNPLINAILGVVAAMAMSSPRSHRAIEKSKRKEGRAGDKLARKAAAKRITIRHITRAAE
jgi:hypothetical protein